MSLTTFRTWIYGELVTVSMMNEQIRDNGNAIWVGTTAGDMDYYTGATNKARLGIGTAGQVLTVNPGATAPEWSGGGMSLIETKLLGAPAASFDFTSIPQTFSHLKIILHVRSNDTGLAYRVLSAILNNDSGANYDYRYISTTLGASTANIGQAQGVTSLYFGNLVPTALATSGMAGSFEISIPNYSGTTFRKNVISEGFLEMAQSDPDNDMNLMSVGNHWRNTSAINRITLFCQAGNFIIGSMASLYGIL